MSECNEDLRKAGKQSADEHLSDVAAQVASRVYALTRGSIRDALPSFLMVAWDDLESNQRALYIEMVKAGIVHDRTA